MRLLRGRKEVCVVALSKLGRSRGAWNPCSGWHGGGAGPQGIDREPVTVWHTAGPRKHGAFLSGVGR